MKPGRKRVIVRAMAVLAVVVGVIVVAFLPAEDPPEAKARRLIAELRQFSWFRRSLIDLGVVQPSKRRDSDAVVQDLAALGQSAVPVCIRALRDDDWHVRWRVAEALGKIGPGPRVAIPALTEALKDGNEYVRCAAAGALAKLGQPGKGLPVLIAALEHESPGYRMWVAEILGEVGPPAKPAIPALREALKDVYEDVRRAAAEALKKIQADGASTRPRRSQHK